MASKIFDLNISTSTPLLATAIHDGHEVRDELSSLFNLSPRERLREEDPHTGYLARKFSNYLIGTRSRFETDLNRARDQAIYRSPEDAWGLQVWKEDGLSDSMVQRSLNNYDYFYQQASEAIEQLIVEHGYAIVYDLHSYNHRREGAEGPLADPEKNPEINLGLGNMDTHRWRPLLNTFTRTYRQSAGPETDIRENVKFDGGHFMHYLHSKFGSSVCVLAIEFKKTFMNEWTNALDENHLKRMAEALKATEEAVIREAAAIHQMA